MQSGNTGKNNTFILKHLQNLLKVLIITARGLIAMQIEYCLIFCICTCCYISNKYSWVCIGVNKLYYVIQENMQFSSENINQNTFTLQTSFKNLT